MINKINNIMNESGLIGKRIIAAGEYGCDDFEAVVIDKIITSYAMPKYGINSGDHGYVDATGGNFGGVGFHVEYLCVTNDGDIVNVKAYKIKQII